MAYRLCRNESVADGVRRVACEQIDKAISEVVDEQLDQHKTVHQLRKRCKKVRGLIRLVRPVFDDFKQDNRHFRDIARQFSYVRDAQSMIECFEALMDHFQDQINRDSFSSVEQELGERRHKISEDRVDLDNRLEQVLETMREAHTRVERWKIQKDGFAAVSGGLMKTYGRACKALHKARAQPSTEQFHEWRKRVKYHYFHSRLLKPAWPQMLNVHRKSGNKLADLLGDDHDLAVLHQTLTQEPNRFGASASVKTLVALIDRRRAELQAAAYTLGARMFAEKPKKIASRFHVYWDTWKAPRERSQ